MLVRPSACPLLRPSVRRLQLQLSFSIRACPSAHSSQFSVRPPLCVCLSVCLFGSSFRLPVSVSVAVAVSASVSSSLLSLRLSLVYNKSAAPRLYLYRCPALAWPVRPCGTLSAASNTSMFILQVKRNDSSAASAEHLCSCQRPSPAATLWLSSSSSCSSHADESERNLFPHNSLSKWLPGDAAAGVVSQLQLQLLAPKYLAPLLSLSFSLSIFSQV